MAKRYTQRFYDTLRGIEQKHASAEKRLKALAEIYVHTTRAGKICLCGMLASDITALPEEAQCIVQQFFSSTTLWIKRMIQQGQKSGEFKPSADSMHVASHFLSTLEGGMFIARIQKTPGYLKTALNDVLHQLKM